MMSSRHPHRAGGGDECRGELHHAGAGQARQHRDPAHHGSGEGHDRARLLPLGRGGRVVGTAPGTALGLLISINIASIVDLVGRLKGGSMELEFIASAPATIRPGEVLTVIAIAIGLSLRRRPIPLGAVRGSNPSKDCGMSTDAFPLSLRALQRTFVYGDRRLEVLRAISLDLRPERSWRWSASRAAASRPCCTSRACSTAGRRRGRD